MPGPSVPDVNIAPYDTVNMVLNTTRTRINDAIRQLGGELLTNNQPFTQQMTITAWRKLQAYLASIGHSRLKRRAILSGVPIVGSQDPAIETEMTWMWFYDGVSYWTPNESPVLPNDMILPLKIAERQTGTYSRFIPMGFAPDGFQTQRKTCWNGEWNWREDGLWMPGSLVKMDLELYYAAYLIDFATNGDTPWYDQPVPILRSLSALSNYICYEFAAPRGDMDAAKFQTDAEADAKLLNNVEVNMKQRTNPSRKGFSGRGGGRGHRC